MPAAGRSRARSCRCYNRFEMSRTWQRPAAALRAQTRRGSALRGCQGSTHRCRPEAKFPAAQCCRAARVASPRLQLAAFQPASEERAAPHPFKPCEIWRKPCEIWLKPYEIWRKPHALWRRSLGVAP